ncbi:MAG: hypothetical protein A2822_04630 [Candidatus Staskawiczbacteria bacterium RIFCSPHIGHO2_01_FULL_41_41]|uniref:Uncharacterized protein n=1 Tax=Candidatus Staskawiczbacteria bacterium RIFCSPHIGHO2_01_FULL_41_41 TaxID=1802203 RepID=A0A1G2HWV6_9BACT|nr:MAG: hypothetical protein A2822_04630 [Candidatus Staskawiczbacteria bacterium RIFCSPHIGHO2_01_FULL_41_41]
MLDTKHRVVSICSSDPDNEEAFNRYIEEVLDDQVKLGKEVVSCDFAQYPHRVFAVTKEPLKK